MSLIEHESSADTSSGDAAVRLAGLEAGNAAESELARLAHRLLELATGLDGREGFSAAIASIDAIETLVCAAEAGKMRLIAQAHACAEQALADGEVAPGDVIRHADGAGDRVMTRTQITAAQLGPVLRMTPGPATGLVTRAVTLTRDLPLTLGRLQSGELSGWHAKLVTDAALTVSHDDRPDLDRMVCGAPLAAGVAGLGGHRAAVRVVKKRIDAALQQLDAPTQTQTKRKQGHTGRHIEFGKPTDDGMMGLFGSLPAPAARAIDTLLDDLARTAPDGDPRTHEQRRADAFLTLFSGPAALSPAARPSEEQGAPAYDEAGQYTVVDQRQNADAQSVWAAIQLLAASVDLTFPDIPKANIDLDVTLETLLGAQRRRTPSTEQDRPLDPEDHEAPDDLTPSGSSERTRPAVIRGLGPIPVELARAMLNRGRLRRIVTDERTGQPLEVGHRQPTATMRDAVLNRDGRCRYPDCERVASLDLDHIRPWRGDRPAAGQSAPENLQALCREHHRAKHQLRWEVRMQPDGSIVWRNNLLDITSTTRPGG